MSRPKLNKEQFLAKMAEGREARKLAQQIIKEHGQKTGEFSTSGLWQNAIADKLKEKSLTFTGNILKYLTDGKMSQFANWLLENLEEFLLEKYQKADEVAKGAFKKKIEECFPDHKLTKKLG